jgi:hypothetical protein
MTDPLRSEILAPTPSYMRSTIAVAAGSVGVLALAMAFARLAHPAAAQAVAVVPPVEASTETPAVIAPPIAVQEPAQPVRSTEIELLFSAGKTTFMQLADISGDGIAMPRHGKPRLVSDDGVETSIASVQAGNVPVAYRRWLGQRVVVDGTCTANVTGFAVVARLTGDTGYAGIDDAHWTARNVLDHGHVTLAATLDACTGTFARDAALPAVIVPKVLDGNDALAAAAKQQLLASSAARDAQDDWTEYEQKGDWWQNQDVQYKTVIVRHPLTGVTWVSLHAFMERGCGDPEVNVWGLFRVQPDGTLAAEQLRKLGDLWSVDQLVDIDGDGELELIGQPWLGLDNVVTRASGEELTRLELPFFGCPC